MIRHVIDHQPRSDEEIGTGKAPWWLLDAFHGSDDAEESAWLAGLPAPGSY